MMQNLKRWGNLFDIDGLEAQAKELTQKTYEPDFWEDSNAAQGVLKEVKAINFKAENFRKMERAFEEALVLIELAQEEGDEGLLPEIKEVAEGFTADFEGFSTSILLSGEYDQNNCILSLHAGAGGTEACDWVAMLLRMYTRWAEAKGYEANLLDYLDG
ncbi:MAG: PCRF domain-containing protein, partial [Defluviitaleaceae bacterium]|nr:PCRF domain-containing protein [Defluviitaleaceae bacterium]